MKPNIGELGTTITGLEVTQWLPEWDEVPFNRTKRQTKPEPSFFMFNLAASTLKSLTGIQRRIAIPGAPRAKETGIQRAHEVGRSAEINRFVHFGYPCSNIGPAELTPSVKQELRKPGWLPTAIIVNILPPRAKRRELILADDLVIKIHRQTDGLVQIELPESAPNEGQLPPMEVIDGQHRLWAFEGDDAGARYQLPVVAFYDLDISWQAYLFWTINIKPKRISPSLAFDLYPLLRTEEWLERFGQYVYRQSRAQELVEALWNHPASPWRGRINMLGQTISQREDRRPMVSQAGWIRSLLATFIKPSAGPGVRIGGLFGAPVGTDKMNLPWSRAQQAAYLIKCWSDLATSISSSTETWAVRVRSKQRTLERGVQYDPAFVGRYSLLTTDQGVRGVLAVFNDIPFLLADKLRLADWGDESASSATDEEMVTSALESLTRQPFAPFVKALSKHLSEFDWRTSSAPGLTEEEQRLKSALRGGTGYKTLRVDLLKHLATKGTSIGTTAKRALEAVEPD